MIMIQKKNNGWCWFNNVISDYGKYSTGITLDKFYQIMINYH